MEFKSLKEAVYDPTGNNFEIRDIFPQKNCDDHFNACFTPWDMLPPYGEVDEWIYDEEYGYYPYTFTDWPFPHWDQAAHENTMMFHYNNVKITRANDYGQMAVVWQDSKRAFDWCVYHYPGYEAWEHGTDVYIAYTDYCGSEWQDPIVLNNVDTPELAGIKPMWVYPADRMIFTGFNQYGIKEGKLGLMFYDDFTWGSNSLPPPYHPDPDGGRVMFMELHIGYLDANDPNQAPAPAILAQNWPNPFNPNTNISFELPQPGPALLEIFDLRGRLVSTLLDKEIGAGKHSLNWDGTDSNCAQLASGVYIYRLSTGRTSASRKMILLK